MLNKTSLQKWTKRLKPRKLPAVAITPRSSQRHDSHFARQSGRTRGLCTDSATMRRPIPKSHQWQDLPNVPIDAKVRLNMGKPKRNKVISLKMTFKRPTRSCRSDPSEKFLVEEIQSSSYPQGEQSTAVPFPPTATNSLPTGATEKTLTVLDAMWTLSTRSNSKSARHPWHSELDSWPRSLSRSDFPEGGALEQTDIKLSITL